MNTTFQVQASLSDIKEIRTGLAGTVRILS